MKLWSGLLSNNSAKVRIALVEKGLDVEIHNLDWTKSNAWGEKPAAFLEVSPRGEVPVSSMTTSLCTTPRSSTNTSKTAIPNPRSSRAILFNVRVAG